MVSSKANTTFCSLVYLLKMMQIGAIRVSHCHFTAGWLQVGFPVLPAVDFLQICPLLLLDLCGTLRFIAPSGWNTSPSSCHRRDVTVISSMEALVHLSELNVFSSSLKAASCWLSIVSTLGRPSSLAVMPCDHRSQRGPKQSYVY